MESEFEALLSKYSYDLPEGRIRSVPLEPRHAAKLLVYDTKTDTIADSTFIHLDEFFPEGTRMVLNESKVLPVRLYGTKVTGGKVEIFVLINEMKDEKRVPCLLNAKVQVGAKLSIAEKSTAEVVDWEDGTYYLSFEGLPLHELLETYGSTPLPHYIHADLPEEVARNRYQTVFAKPGKLGSVAAPTASLHFTQEVFEKLDAKHIVQIPVTLHVGRGTFLPLKEEHVKEKKLHKEFYEISPRSAELLQEAKGTGLPVLAVGTTAMRTLESYALTGERQGDTSLFIQPPHHFTYATMMLTNFHLPKTSLMMLVDAFLKDKGSKKTIQEIYQHAIEQGYKFYSFGDSMLIL